MDSLLHPEAVDDRIFQKVGPKNVRPIEWIWRPWIPGGSIVMFEGLPDGGKSTISCDIAARITKDGVMPDGFQGQTGGVILINAEDPKDQVVTPRLIAAGAKMSRCRVVTQPLRVPEDLPMIERVVRKLSVKLVVIDPMASSIGASMTNDQKMRRTLAPLRDMCERTGCTVMLVRHWIKTKGVHNLLLKGSGTIGITGAARSMLAAVAMGDGRHLLGHTKCNVAQKAGTWTYALDDGRVVWGDELADRLEDLIDGGATGEKLEKCVRAMATYMAEGHDAANDIVQHLRQAGLSTATIRRAADAIGVVKGRKGFGLGSHAVWTLPEGYKLPPEEEQEDEDEEDDEDDDAVNDEDGHDKDNT